MGIQHVGEVMLVVIDEIRMAFQFLCLETIRHLSLLHMPLHERAKTVYRYLAVCPRRVVRVGLDHGGELLVLRQTLGELGCAFRTHRTSSIV